MVLALIQDTDKNIDLTVNRLVMERITLSEIETSKTANGSRIYLQTVLKKEGNEGFTLTLLDGENVWEGYISENDLDNFSDSLKMDFNTYVKETKAAFTQEDTTNLNFECHFKTTGVDMAQLQWKKIPTHDIKYNLGSVSLKKSSKPAARICDVLSHCISTTHNLQTRVQTLEADNERLTTERLNALMRLDKCVSAKEELEKDLYSKFVLVLNSKKERIKSLMELREPGSLEGEADSLIPSTSRGDHSSQVLMKTSGNRNEVAAKHKSELVGDESDVDTDEEATSSPKKQKKTVRAKKSEVLESSLNLGEDEEQIKSEAVARRPRRQATTKKQTPTKPTLPRVTSGSTSDRPGSAGRRSSMRKSGSNNSNKSSDNLDPDALLDSF